MLGERQRLADDRVGAAHADVERRAGDAGVVEAVVVERDAAVVHEHAFDQAVFLILRLQLAGRSGELRTLVAVDAFALGHEDVLQTADLRRAQTPGCSSGSAGRP